jgi:hypothetical protein
MTITHTATDTALRKQIGRFNTELDKHTAAAAAVDGVPQMDAAAMLALDAAALSSEAAKRLTARLKLRQDAVILSRQRLELLEACQPEADAAAESAQKEFAEAQTTVSEHLEAAGLGVESQRAARFGHIATAERQFAYSVTQSEPVRLADVAQKAAVGHAAANRKSTASAKSAVADSLDRLTTFIHNTLKG